MTHRPLTDADLDTISARAESALPGPWRLFDQWEPNNLARENVVLWNDPHLAEGVDGWVCQVPGDPANAEFIAHARADVPRLIADLRASRARVAVLSTANTELHAEVERLRGFLDGEAQRRHEAETLAEWRAQQ